MKINKKLFFSTILVSVLILLGNGCATTPPKITTSTVPLTTVSPQQTTTTPPVATTTKLITTNNKNNSSIFHPISESEACELALKFNAFQEKVDITLIHQGYKCETSDTKSSVFSKTKDLWLIYLLPTSAHPRYQEYLEYLATKSLYDPNFVTLYSIGKETSVIFPTPPTKVYIESKNSFRALTNEEYNELFELMNK